MKLKFLGTAAAEGIPSMFCDCEVCREAKNRGDKNIRTRSQAVLDDKIIFDFNADTYMHFLAHDLDIKNIRTCLLTHSHDDHLYPEELKLLRPNFSYRPISEPFTIYTGKSGFDRIDALIQKFPEVYFDTKLLTPFEPFDVDCYTVYALPATHPAQTSPFVFIVEKDNKVMLYNHDTSMYPNETITFLKNFGKKFDFITSDCTGGAQELPDGYAGHMNIRRNLELRDLFIELNLYDSNAPWYLNHFSHNSGLTVLFEEFSEIAATYGFMTSYDGCEVEF